MLDQTWVVIAAYQEERLIGEVVQGVLQVAPNIIVVDDGSADATVRCAARAGARVLRHCINLGQGAALQTGIDYALRQNAAFIVTFDADGQHSPADIPRAVDALAQSQSEILLGSRFLGQPLLMPLRKRLLLRLAIAYTFFTTGLSLTDAHNGFRVLSRRAAERIRLRQDRMSHASEILEHIARLNIPYMEFPAQVKYTPYSLAKGQRASGALNIVIDSMIGRMVK